MTVLASARDASQRRTVTLRLARGTSDRNGTGLISARQRRADGYCGCLTAAWRSSPASTISAWEKR